MMKPWKIFPFLQLHPLSIQGVLIISLLGMLFRLIYRFLLSYAMKWDEEDGFEAVLYGEYQQLYS